MVVVGAGPCALVGVKELLEAGHEVVCLAKSQVIGGVFSGRHPGTYPLIILYHSLWQPLRRTMGNLVPMDIRERYTKPLEQRVEALGPEEKREFRRELMNGTIGNL